MKKRYTYSKQTLEKLGIIFSGSKQSNYNLIKFINARNPQILHKRINYILSMQDKIGHKGTISGKPAEIIGIYVVSLRQRVVIGGSWVRFKIRCVGSRKAAIIDPSKFIFDECP